MAIRLLATIILLNGPLGFSRDQLTREEFEIECQREFERNQIRAEKNQPPPANKNTERLGEIKPRRRNTKPKLAVSAGEDKDHDYTGSIGEAAINMRLRIFKRKARGDFFFLRDPVRLYEIVGHNESEKRLDLTVTDDGVSVAKVRLHKGPKVAGGIQWAGTMHMSSGKNLPMYFSRLLEQEPQVARPRTIGEFDKINGYERYEGSVTDSVGRVAMAVFKLKFRGIKCRGFYYQRYPNGSVSKVLRLEGDNPNGILSLRETDSDPLIAAEFHLQKERTVKEISWIGKLTNIRDNRNVKKVEFHRRLNN